MLHRLRQKMIRVMRLICLGFLLAVLLAPASYGINSNHAVVSVYTQQLRDKDATIRQVAASNLGRIGMTAVDAIPELLTLLKDENELVRLSAITALGQINAKPDSTVPALLNILKQGQEEELRSAAAISLSQMGSPAIQELIKGLTDRKTAIRINSASALGQMGTIAKPSVSKLIQLIKIDPALQQQAIESLGQIGTEAEAAIPSLVESLQHPNWQIRSSAAQSLGSIGYPSKSAIPALVKTLNDPDAVVRQRSAFAISKIGTVAIPDLIKTLKDKSTPIKVRGNIAYALGEIGISAKDSIPELVNLLQDDNQFVREGSIFALSQMGLSGTPFLTQSLKSNDERIRNSAASTFGKIAESLENRFSSNPSIIGFNFNSPLSLSEINQSLDSLTQAKSVMESSNPSNPLIGGRARFSEEIANPIRRTIDTLQVQRNALILGIALQFLLIFLVAAAVGAFFLFWLRPLVLLRVGRAIVVAKQERETVGQSLLTAKKFLEQTGATIHRVGRRSLHITSAIGRLKAHTPLTVLLAIDTPTAEDVADLMKQSGKMGEENPKRVGILLYQESPDTLFRVRMAEVRLRDQFVLIPIPLAAVEKALIDPAACRGLLAQYADRYLPGADLFDDRNAIGDTLSFFGRSELLHRLEEELLRNQGVGLFGLRKSGKTSILLQLGFSLRRHPIVHLDLQPYGSKTRYGAELFNAILGQLSLLLQNPSREKIRESRFSENQFSSESAATDLATEFIRRILIISSELTQIGYELPILIFLDEIERILPNPTDSVEKVKEFNAFFGSLRALSQEHSQIGILVADVHPDCNRINQWTQEGVPTNPVFSFFKEIFLSPLSAEETATMLTDISRLMGRSFEQDVISTIHQDSGGHPFIARQLASLICAKITGKDNEKVCAIDSQRYIQRPFVYSGILKDYLSQNIWADLKKRDFKAALVVLKILACNLDIDQHISEEKIKNRLVSTFTESQYLDALLWLEKVGLLIHWEIAENDYYRSNMPLFSRWIQMELGEEEIHTWQI